MKEKGFAPILILVVVVIAAFGAGGAYFLNNEINGPKQVLPDEQKRLERPVNEATSSTQSVEETSSPTPISTPSSPITPRQLSALEILRNRQALTPTQSVPTPTPTPTRIPTPTPTPLACPTNSSTTDTRISGDSSGAILSLSPSNGTYKPGDNFSIEVKLDPNGHNINAIDAMFLYDTNKITINSITEAIGDFHQYANGFSLIDSVTGGLFNKPETIAVLNFQVNDSASGNAEVKFLFNPNNLTNTTDSNVVEKNNVRDALGSVLNGVYTIKPNGCK